jgi:hypothetical protein
MRHVDYSSLPEHMQEVAREYVEQGIEAAHHDFFYELLTNDLFGVFQFGDGINIANLKVWMTWLYNEPPGTCWGSPAKVDAWVKAHETAPESESESELREAWGK